MAWSQQLGDYLGQHKPAGMLANTPYHGRLPPVDVSGIS